VDETFWTSFAENVGAFDPVGWAGGARRRARVVVTAWRSRSWAALVSSLPRSLLRGAHGGDVHAGDRPNRSGAVMVPAVVWLYWSGSTGWGHLSSGLAWWSVSWTTLCARAHQEGRHLPLLLIFTGVVAAWSRSASLAFFVGPVVLAITTRC